MRDLFTAPHRHPLAAPPALGPARRQRRRHRPPANNGLTTVDYVLVDALPDRLDVHFHAIEYDHERLAHEMRAEGLPEEFVETVLTGWWTTCTEILSAKERALGRY